jgi:hypothetical protein
MMYSNIGFIFRETVPLTWGELGPSRYRQFLKMQIKKTVQTSMGSAYPFLKQYLWKLANH